MRRGWGTIVPCLSKSCSVELFVFFSNLWKNRNLLPDFSADFCAVQLRDILKTLFWGTTLYSGLCNSAHICSKFLFLLGFLSEGSGLRLISLLYAELRIFQKRHTFTLLFRAKMNRKAGFAVHKNRSNLAYKLGRGGESGTKRMGFYALKTEANLIFAPL